MNADGRNTAVSTSAIAISAVPTSSMVRRAASRGFMPSAILRSTFSTTTIASSTTMPTASTNPNSERLFRVKPNRLMKKNAPISETGMATIGMTAARQVCRNMMMTSTTSRTASMIVVTTSLTDCWMNWVGS